MSLARLNKQLQREIKRNPQKAGGLGLLLLVAGWFWAPLIFKKDESVSAIASPVAPAASPVVTNPITTANGAASNPTAGGGSSTAMPSVGEKPKRWQDLAEGIDRDQRMLTVPVVTEGIESRSPFVSPRKVEAEPKQIADEEAAPPVVEPPMSPEQAGLEVTGTILSRERRTAMINGQAYGMGDELEPKPGVIFTIAGIGPNGVLLERNGQQFALAIRRSPRSGRVDLRPGN